ncbi:DNA-binding response regulator [Spirochaetia bacterium]|nr:DNA-binding response regulator [Spirochaetia bacterium]
MLEIAICDDDPAITGFLEAALMGYGHLLPEGLHIQVFHQGAAFIGALKKAAGERCPFDIIFLDIELGDTSGIALAEEIRKTYEEPVLVFVSAHESYCKELFQFDTAAFLSKPIEKAKVEQLLLRIYRNIRNPKAVFTCQCNDDIHVTPLADILYFESKLRKIDMVTKTALKTFYGKLNEVEERIQRPGFLRIHHSILVNIDNMKGLEKNTIVFPGGRTLPLVRGRIKEIRNKISDYYAGVKP